MQDSIPPMTQHISTMQVAELQHDPVGSQVLAHVLSQTAIHVLGIKDDNDAEIAQCGAVHSQLPR